MNPPVGVSDPALGVPLWAIGSYLAGALGAWLWLRLVPRLGFLDRPGARRLHRQPTPRGGGLGIVAAALLALLLLEPAGEASLAIASAGAALAVVGLYDDWRGAGVAMRLFVQLVAAAIAAAAVAGPSASLVRCCSGRPSR
ncbi:MAG: hypothetical protein RML12_06570 [Xanthomonadales bacterium]|nr:hypothetical protein [Xanthomonadales bacterium]